MANPDAPLEGSGRRVIFWEDAAHVGTPYFPLGDGHIAMGGGNDLGTVPGAAINGRVSGGLRGWGYFADTFKPFTLTAVTTEQLIWDPASGKKFRLLGGQLKATVECKLNLLDGTGGTVVLTLGAGDSMPLPFDLGPIGILSGAANANLYVTSSASADIVGTVWGVEES